MKLILPLEVLVGKKVYRCNLNQYRNMHYRVLNSTKQRYSELIQPMIPKAHKPFKVPVRLVYTLYWGSKRRCDISNICSIVDKYSCDAIVKAGILPDDDYKNVQEVVYKWGGIDKDFPRCELVIEEIKE
jgi:hypothetical protein